MVQHENTSTTNVVEETTAIANAFEGASNNILEITHRDSLNREKGYYGILYGRPSRTVRSILSLDREVLVLISTFSDQQSRTIQTAREILQLSNGRLEASTFIVIHRDPRGNAKLKNWGREQSLVVLPIYTQSAEFLRGRSLLKYLSHELFSHDPFDVTGPVADDLNFYGRREEALNLARKLQSGQIRSCFGVRKIGKTSIIHRFIKEVQANFDSKILLIDCSDDSLFNLSAPQLLHSISLGVQELESQNTKELIPLSADRAELDLSEASARLSKSFQMASGNMILVFDEVDYITPSSPTAQHWQQQFNGFWRNLRVVYQRMALEKRSLSIFVSGVSSKWFSVASINGIENAALSFVPEEYLSPLPRGAADAMIRRLGKIAGLNFSPTTAQLISETCCDMPFWIRKACSYVHARIEVGLRPFEPQLDVIREYLREFILTDGSTMAAVALGHLLRVYPELKEPVMLCARSSGRQVPEAKLRILEKYGIIRSIYDIKISGTMLDSAIKLIADELEGPNAEVESSVAGNMDHKALSDWAEELATISRRRNLIERKLRGICGNFIRYSVLDSRDPNPARERVLRVLDARRRSELVSYDMDNLMTKLYWLELVAVIKKEWPLFERIFGDRTRFDEFANEINSRPDTHAKEIDLADVALHRRALEWFEERLARI